MYEILPLLKITGTNDDITLFGGWKKCWFDWPLLSGFVTGFMSGRYFYFIGHKCKVVGLLVSNDVRVVCFHVRGLCWWCNVVVAHGWKFTKPTMLNITTGKQQWCRFRDFFLEFVISDCSCRIYGNKHNFFCHLSLEPMLECVIPKQTSSEEFRPINFCSCVVRNKTMHG